MVAVKQLLQTVFFVNDLTRTAEAYSRILGIGPWDRFNWTAPLAYDFKNRGRAVEAHERLAFADVGPTELEIIEHVAGDSFYSGYMAEHGEGVLQLDFTSSNVDADQRELEARGGTCLQSGRFGDTGAYAIVERPSLHVLWEAACMANDFGVEPDQVGVPQDRSADAVTVTHVDEVAIVSNEALACVEAHGQTLGIEGWHSDEVERQIEYRGQGSSARKAAWSTDLAGLSLQVLQPISGTDILTTFLNDRGPGVCYLGAPVDDLDHAVRTLETEGMELLQSEPSDDGRAAYMWHPDLAVIWRFRTP